jgi:ATP-dependent helicase/nuclease subunit A
VSDAGGVDPRLPDAAARQRIASDLQANLLVEAGAGSGKTTELVSRMVALIETGAATAEQIAAVTFTRKAAAELAERFQMRIEERLAGRGSGNGSGAPATPDALERLARALDDIDRVFVGTIHAFCARLLKERPLEVGLDPAFRELSLEERPVLRRRFWHAHLERLAREADPVLEELASAGLRPAQLYGLFERLVENPDVDFPAAAVGLPSGEEIEAVRKELEALVEEAQDLVPEREPEGTWDPLQKKMRRLHFLRDVTGWREPADFYEALATVCKPGPHGHRVTQNRWKNGASAKALCARVNEFAVGDTPAGRLLERWQAHRYWLAIRLARHAADEFAEHRRRIGRLDFQDLLVLTAELLRTRPDVRRDLGTRYRRILVDELQDTDPLQAEILLLLASEPDESESHHRDGARRPAWLRATPRPGALFVVGDPKQSIYRFRRADIELYGMVKERFRAFGSVLALTANFRSRPAIGALVNDVFSGEGFFPPAQTSEQAAFEPLNTQPPTRPVRAEGVFTYRIAPQERNAAAAARDEANRLAAWIRRRVDAAEREAGDFLILTRFKHRLDVYARALEAQGLPVQVTGAGVSVEEELRELEIVLECMIDPTNPVRVLAALVGLFFGIDYERLVAHRLAGGGLDAMRPGRRGHPDVLAALRTLHRWWRSASREPADVFVGALASELGLLPYAAAGELGALRAGALLYALDAVRQSALAGDTSLPGALEALRAAFGLSEAEAPLEPGRTDAVRIMNLHQAKGLEATVVILADPSPRREPKPELHVRRETDGSAVGYLCVTQAAGGFGGDAVLAAPAGWREKEDAERRFKAAEETRLLYVAVTRAKEELLVVRWPDTEGTSPWCLLHRWLDEHATVLDLDDQAPGARAELSLDVQQARRRTAEAAERLAAARIPSFVRATVTAVAKGPEGPREEAAPLGPAPGAEEEAFRGFSWGSAVHGALAAAASGNGPAALRATCRNLLVEHGRPLDEHGEPLELEELLGLVRAVEGSEIWARARRAERLLAEIPFSAPGLALERPQLDFFAGPSPPGRPLARRGYSGPGATPTSGAEPPLHVLEGVIDLAFREPDGWVIVDYKTDVGRDPDFPRRHASYRRQVDLYAEAWSRLSGEPVKERVLFFTTQGWTERW